MTVVIREQGSPRQKYKGFKADIRAALKEAAEEWHGRYLPKHFTPAAYNAYKYAPRTTRYGKRKMRLKGHTRPLVFTGRMKKMVTSVYRISGTAKRATVSMNGPRYMYQYNKRGKIVDKAKEMTMTTRREETALAKHLERGLVDRQRERNPVETTRMVV